ncbi:unnamed protein product [Polarella glacialis]|uniref:Uncharacterized protein n=1 Tax=Polarella glacialis TaxID=89957 RepID=A0A813LG43_POLGL|nr:unnamed protein product [Polarella glacialis]CAE8730951.1 unnamed protein product [Polarella glacialis]|eukprot:CAMPEP_0115071472 /NCGR_PEP_ID=MMETSP0227-20121206/13691_1 /TAXON_ID=89957 /ORGANISM="Polarella glacialis, Strain CCMP 1383" /LENGTH=110 /DNA_ID=CAMNT_0002458107 /DNA_START=354 /DNA_END=686 /DNA_ORIENTATION=-
MRDVTSSPLKKLHLAVGQEINWGQGCPSEKNPKCTCAAVAQSLRYASTASWGAPANIALSLVVGNRSHVSTYLIMAVAPASVAQHVPEPEVAQSVATRMQYYDFGRSLGD